MNCNILRIHLDTNNAPTETCSSIVSCFRFCHPNLYPKPRILNHHPNSHPSNKPKTTQQTFSGIAMWFCIPKWPQILTYIFSYRKTNFRKLQGSPRENDLVSGFSEMEFCWNPRGQVAWSRRKLGGILPNINIHHFLNPNAFVHILMDICK